MSVPAKKLYSAADIAKMGLEGLPTTKGKIIDRATSEGWYFEEKKGIGGIRRVYEIPRRYLGEGDAGESTSGTSMHPPKVAGIIAGGTANVDPELLQIAEEAFEEWLRERGATVDPRKRGAIVAVLYNYLAKGADQGEVATMLKVIGD